MEFEPTNLEMFLTRLAFYFFGRTVYKEYADSLPINGHETVLDFGSGMGTVAYYTSKRLQHGNLVCLDISSKWLAACEKKLSKSRNVSFLHGDIYALPLQEESFDLIYCHFVLHDIADSELKRIIPDMKRGLKPNGLLALREPLGDTGKIKVILGLIEENGFSKKDSRVTDIPLMHTTLESIYIKN